jgi:hypothetical protein
MASSVARRKHLGKEPSKLTSTGTANSLYSGNPTQFKGHPTRVFDFVSPSEFGHSINRLSRQQAFYLRIYRQLLNLRKTLDKFKSNQLEPEDCEQLQNLRDKTVGLEQQLVNLLPSDQPEQSELQLIETELNQIAESFKALEERVEETLPTDDLGEFKRGQDKSITDAPR